MHQIVLSDSAAAELGHLSKLDQLELVAEFSNLRKNPVEPGKGGVGEIHKGNRTLYRFRWKDHRVYFEKRDDQLIIHHVLHRNTLRDFMIRSNLEDGEFEESAKFWKFLEQRQMKVKTPPGS
jgi:mRNA-degrading endonuclease RelE of RelBE toxin-antitoxin system